MVKWRGETKTGSGGGIPSTGEIGMGPTGEFVFVMALSSVFPFIRDVHSLLALILKPQMQTMHRIDRLMAVVKTWVLRSAVSCFRLLWTADLDPFRIFRFRALILSLDFYLHLQRSWNEELRRLRHNMVCEGGIRGDVAVSSFGWTWVVVSLVFLMCHLTRCGLSITGSWRLLLHSSKKETNMQADISWWQCWLLE